jgi:dihydroorotase
MKIHIKNGRLIDPASGTDAKQDVFIAAGKIVALGSAPAGYTANRTIDASGLVVCPGLVDLAVRLREPGFEYMATLESEMQAAAAGGVTSLACPPDTDPPLDEPGLVEMLKFRARNLNQSHVYPVGALTVGLKGSQLTEMAELTDAGCVAFSHADAPLSDTQLLLRALQYAATFDFPVWLRPQDPASRAAVSRTTARSRRAWVLPRFPCAQKRSRCRRYSCSRAKPARASTYAACRARKASTWCARRKRAG